MEHRLSSLGATHLLQHTLRSLCIQQNSQWVYAVFWRILPRIYPPPKWDGQGANDRSRGNRRNWILVWEDGFCNFPASAAEINSGDYPGSTAYGNCEFQLYQGLKPELFFKMSHEMYNHGEGLIGKVAADHSHKWIYKESNDQQISFLSSCHDSADSHPRTWEAQFQSGIKTIALIAVRKGVIQLGAVHKVIEDLNYVDLLRKKFSYMESIPGVLLPHSSSSAYPFKADEYGSAPQTCYHVPGTIAPQPELYDHFNQPMKIIPSISSLEALLSKLPSVVPSPASAFCESQFVSPPQLQLEYSGLEKVTKQEIMDEEEHSLGESSSSISAYYHQQQHFHHQQDLSMITSNRPTMDILNNKANH